MRSRRNIRQNIVILLVFITLLGVISITAQASPVFAHRSGCHRWHSCPSDSGSYSCGDTGYSNYCTAPTYNTYTPPTITVKDEVIERNIPIREVTIDNPNEYAGFKKLVTEGSEGSQTQTTSVSYSDGVESSRGAASISTVRESVNTVYEVGSRKKPTAWVDYLTKSDKQSFWSFLLTEYDISASAQPDRDYALIKNDKVIRLSKSGKTGILNFEGVGLRTGDILSVGTYTGSQFLWFMPTATKISELSTVDTDKLTVLAEYDSLHNKISDRTNEKTVIKECSQDIKDSYIASLDKSESIFFDLQSSDRIYYTEIPCDIKIPKG